MNTTFIYALVDPIEDEVRYIGKANDPQRRVKSHLRDKGDCYKTRWINCLKDQGLAPKLVVLEEVDASCWPDRERYWISLYRSLGCRLTNTCEGGLGGGPKWSEETRAKHMARMVGHEPWNKGKHLSAPHREKISKSTKGGHLSAAHREKISKSTKGKQAGKNAGNKLSDECKAKIGKAHIGLKHSDATKAKMAESRRLWHERHKKAS